VITVPALAVGTLATAGARALEVKFRRPHHRFRHPIGFAFVFVARFIDREFRLDDQGHP
jgi:hypothetical protein